VSAGWKPAVPVFNSPRSLRQENYLTSYTPAVLIPLPLILCSNSYLPKKYIHFLLEALDYNVHSEWSKRMEQKDLTMGRILSAVFIMTIFVLMMIGSGAFIELEGDLEEVGPLIVLPILGLLFILVAPKISSFIADSRARHIVFLVLVESGVIMGFALSFLSGQPHWVLGLGTLAILFYIAKWPKAQ